MKGTTEDKMVGWHPRLNGHEFEQAPRVGDGQGSLVSCCPRGRKESDTAEWTELNTQNHPQVYYMARDLTLAGLHLLV